MFNPLDLSLEQVADSLRSGDLSATELAEEAIASHEDHDLTAYKHFDADAALEAARDADARLSAGTAGPMCGIPVSVKDLYGVNGMPTFAGTPRQLPDAWSRDAWLVSRLREQGAVFTGKTHTVEFAYGAVGVNPHWGAPRNPWDAGTHRIPGGSSSGAGVSLWEGSALVALGSDTGGSVRIPASFTGCVGHKSTHGRWSVDGVVQLSSTLDSVGALTRTVEDAVYFMGSIDPAWGDPQMLRLQLASLMAVSQRVGVPSCRIWDACQSDIASRLRDALHDLKRASWSVEEIDGSLLDQAGELYMTGGLASAELIDFMERELAGWRALLHPTVGERVAGAPAIDSDTYRTTVARRAEFMARASSLFEHADVLALPTAVITPPPVDELAELDRYVKVNAATLRPTCPISMLGLCAVTVPAGLDDAGMPVGLQLVAPGSQDEALLGAALAVERTLGTARERLGAPPRR